jgi:hypothetical protein
MILQSTQLSPRQKAAMERIAGRTLQTPENIVVTGGTPKVASMEDRQHAAERMRYQLYLLDPSERRMSIEDWAAALLEKSEANA